MYLITEIKRKVIIEVKKSNSKKDSHKFKPLGFVKILRNILFQVRCDALVTVMAHGVYIWSWKPGKCAIILES